MITVDIHKTNLELFKVKFNFLSNSFLYLFWRDYSIHLSTRFILKYLTVTIRCVLLYLSFFHVCNDMKGEN